MNVRSFVVHCKRASYDVLVDRTTKWGNRFSHLPRSRAQYQVATREEAVDRYDEWLDTQPQLLADLHELTGKKLGCWCDPLLCHGHVLARRANGLRK